MFDEMKETGVPASSRGSGGTRSAVARRIAAVGAGAGGWVKGAVNLDEDLHFSTYYLRLSTAPLTRPLYPGYSAFVASYEGFDETYYLLSEECRRTAVALVERSLRQPRFLPGVLAEIRLRSDRLAEIFPAELSAADLERMPRRSLLALYRRHDRYTRALYRPARLPEALDRGDSYFTGYLRGHLQERGLAGSAADEAFAILSAPTTPSVLAQELAEFDAIVQQARQAPPPVAEPGRARLLLAPELLRRLDAHRRRWQFLPYHGYGRRQLATLDSYVARLLTELHSERPAVRPIAERAVERERTALLARLRLDPAHRALFALYPEIGAVKLYRRYAQLRNFYYLDLLLAEIARRLDVSEWTVRCMLPEEIMAALAVGRLAQKEARAIERRLSGCVYLFLEGREEILTGDEAAAVRRLFRAPADGGGRSAELRGVVASRGRAAGPCKVVIRADDCRDFPTGAILVSESTDPDLVPLLRRAGGVLTEQGGVTSHAALICRELGIPTIIGIDGLLGRVRDGDVLDVDAEQGVVTLAQAGKGATTREKKESAVGAKAHNLGIVRSLGFRVPEYVLVDYKEVRRTLFGRARAHTDLVARVVRELGVKAGDRLAVRSSAVAEDREDGSAAGAYRSLLDVPAGGLGPALREFVDSNGSGRRAGAYRGSVIIQRMVQPDWAGVCITRDARTGRGDAVIIELCAGHNRGVTGGTVRPDRVVVDRLTGDILSDERRPGAPRRGLDVTALVRDFLTLESRFGRPLDIEWAMAGGALYILQARPVVGVPSGPAAQGELNA